MSRVAFQLNNMNLEHTVVLIGVAMMLGQNLHGNHYTIRVSDLQGLPVGGAMVTVMGSFIFPENKGRRVLHGKTDSYGVFRFEERLYRECQVRVEKSGYYETAGVLNPVVWEGDRKTLPTRVESNVVLKPMRNAVPMKVGRILNEPVPELDRELGYDLRVGDWVKPFGAGETPHFWLTYSYRFTDTVREEWVALRFDNAHDGLVPFDPDRTGGSSLLRSDYVAPDGPYQNEWQWSRYLEYNGGNRMVPTLEVSTFEANRCYYLRLDTEVDEDGTVVSAFYGKIYGDLLSQITALDKGQISWGAYYLNPTAQDRNVEFDPEKPMFSENSRNRKITALQGVSETWSP